MEKFRKSEKICLLCGVGSWAVLLLSVLLRSVLPNLLQDLLAGVWFLTALCGAALAAVCRGRLGKRRSNRVRWGMLLSALMLWIQLVTVGLVVFQGSLEWTSGEAGLISFGIATGVAGLYLCLYVLLGRVGQNRLERRQQAEDLTREREI